MSLEKLYSVKEAAAALGGISVKTLELWFLQGRVKRTKLGRRTFLKESELQRLIDAGTISDPQPLPNAGSREQAIAA
jgi:hypothetical protein